MKGVLGPQFPQASHQEDEPLGVFPALLFCNADIPGNHAETDGQSHMGNRREEVVSLSHMNQRQRWSVDSVLLF